jgi:hypothetical protein
LKLKSILKFWGLLGDIGKLSANLDLIEFISQFPKLRCERYYFCVDFVPENSIKLEKLGLEGKIS